MAGGKHNLDFDKIFQVASHLSWCYLVFKIWALYCIIFHWLNRWQC